MSEKKDNGESELERPGPSEGVQVDAGAEEDFPSLVMNPVVEENIQEQEQSGLANNSDPGGGVSTSEHVPVHDELAEKDSGVTSELDNTAEVPALDNSAKEPALNDISEDPTSSNIGEDLVTNKLAEDPASNHSAEGPATNKIAEDPPSNHSAEGPATKKIAEDPASNHNAEDPATNKIVEDPASNHSAEGPASSHIAEGPASSHIAEDPASSHIAEDPASNNIAEGPASNDIVEEPASNDIAKEPTSSDIVEGPASHNYAQDPLTENVDTDPVDTDPDLIIQQENVVDQDALLDEKYSKESDLADAKVENDGGPDETDVKAANSEDNCFIDSAMKEEKEEDYPSHEDGPSQSFLFDYTEGEESGTEEDQAAFMKELEIFHKEKSLEFKPPKFYGEGLNCLKLWRAVTRLGGYDQVTSCKLWRQVGESFRPPKTCTTVSWSFRIFYEKALLEYEKHKIRTGELQVPIASLPEPMVLDHQVGGNQSSGSGRARRDAAARAMQGWHSQRLLGNGEVGDPIIKDKSSVSLLKRDKLLKSIGLKRKKPSSLERAAVKVARTKVAKPQMETLVVDVGAPADWVKINVRRTKDCFEVYALVPGLLREEVHVQSDPAGRLVISGEPEQHDNPWGVTPFKKVVSLPSRIDPHQTSAVVTLHGQLFVRAPFEQSES
ncbi:hypothetical protein J5N97_005478 [Dioscorea zingiberensis]|uniref:AT-rich interactive domain-containing protein 3 n=1 Tax=Dioscorea zingiberensis TaxID=325984 RepID=A0A9D5HT44_9LILI|nr:hypothetical protein J5N97_005478 [Dioscorea zingiberensis]